MRNANAPLGAVYTETDLIVMERDFAQDVAARIAIAESAASPPASKR